jgi:hypothetical protein
MYWQLIIILYLAIGVVQLISTERKFFKEYRGDLYDFMATQIDAPFDVRPIARLVLAVMMIFLWLPLDVWAIGKFVARRLGLTEPDSTHDKYDAELERRKQELRMYGETAEVRKRYMDAVNKRGKKEESDD